MFWIAVELTSPDIRLFPWIPILVLREPHLNLTKSRNLPILSPARRWRSFSLQRSGLLPPSRSAARSECCAVIRRQSFPHHHCSLVFSFPSPAECFEKSLHRLTKHPIDKRALLISASHLRAPSLSRICISCKSWTGKRRRTPRFRAAVACSRRACL